MRSSEAYAGQHNSIFGKPAAPFEMVGQADAKQPRRCIFILNWAAAAGITFQEVSGSLGDLGEQQQQQAVGCSIYLTRLAHSLNRV